jgi:hypothetical protein
MPHSPVVKATVASTPVRVVMLTTTARVGVVGVMLTTTARVGVLLTRWTTWPSAVVRLNPRKMDDSRQSSL